MGCRALLQGIFPTQGSSLGLVQLWHCRWTPYPWSTREAHLALQETLQLSFKVAVPFIFPPATDELLRFRILIGTWRCQSGVLAALMWVVAPHRCYSLQFTDGKDARHPCTCWFACLLALVRRLFRYFAHIWVVFYCLGFRLLSISWIPSFIRPVFQILSPCLWLVSSLS